MATLVDVLNERVREATLSTPLEKAWVQCHACGHECRIPPGAQGVCKVRVNRDGVLLAPWGYVAGLQIDPIEKKPFFHAWPGTTTLSFGMLGCDLHCGYCQNWITSQALRDPHALAPAHDVGAADIVAAAVRSGARVIVSTYNEPLITAEWAFDVFQLARAEGLATAIVSNGNGTPTVLDYLAPVLDLCKIDLKSFADRRYRQLGGRLQPVLDTIAGVHARGTWLEIVTLVVPGFNDSDEELRDIATFLAGVSPDIPWHVTAFHADYKMADTRDTTARDLERAAGIGREAGLRFVYAGNAPGSVGRLEDTRCLGCGTTLVERRGYHVRRNHVTADGTCPECAEPVPGRWR